MPILYISRKTGPVGHNQAVNLFYPGECRILKPYATVSDLIDNYFRHMACVDIACLPSECIVPIESFELVQ